MKVVVTQDILDQNPDLVTLGVQIGDEVEVPDNPVSLEDEVSESNSLDSDPPPPPPPPPGDSTGGDRPPTGPRRP